MCDGWDTVFALSSQQRGRGDDNVGLYSPAELDHWGGFSEQLHLTAPRIRPRQEAENERVWGC